MVLGKVLNGPEESIAVPRCSIGKLMYDALKSKNKDQVALIDGFTKMEVTYGEIFESTRQLACGLRKLGLCKSDVVAIINDSTVHYAYPILACLYLGATINPLNPAYLKRELLHTLLISQPRFIICSDLIVKTVLSLRKDLPSVECIIVIGTGVTGETIDLVDVMTQGSDSINDFQPLGALDIDWEQDVAAILCSSGTTGLPKGVMLTHKNLREPFGYLHDPKIRSVGSGDVIIGVAPCFHIFGFLVKLVSLFYGGKLLVMDKFKPNVYLQTIVDYKVNRLFIVPSLAVFLAKSPLVLQYDLSSIKDLICGASALGKDVQQFLEERFNVSLRQCYGMTELSGAITFTPLHSSALSSVGVPVSGVSLKVVDPETNETLSTHQPGEIRIKGPMIMKGYMGNEDASKAMIDEEGFLCTGDIGYYDEEDNVFIVDRLKELIKYKGFQVPPAELEDVLLSHPEIKDAGVIGIPDERCGELPLAFVVKQPGATVNEKIITDYVADCHLTGAKFNSIKVELYEASDALWWSTRMKENKIICGADYYGPVAQNSLGIQIFESLLNNDDKHEAFIHAETLETVRYSELLKITCQVAESLRNAGYKQNEFISVCSENSLLFFVPVIAGLYNGMILAPLNTSYIHGELVHATGITKPKIVFCSKHVLEKIIRLKRTANYIERIVVLDAKSISELRLQSGTSLAGIDTLDGFISKYCDVYFDEYSFKPLELDPKEQLAVVLCSSGTTGLPKGVMTTHFNINIRINHMNDPRISTDMNEGFSMFGLLPFFHGYGFMVGLTNIIRGNKIIVISRFDEKLFLDSIERFQVTHLHLVPPIMVFLAKHPMVLNYNFSCVQEIMCGAAPLSKETQALVKKRIPNAELRQAYGLTEATLAVTITPLGANKDGSSGKVISGMQCAVRDPTTGEHLAVHQVGELCFKGDLVTKGYYGNPEATAECFGTDGWLRTGDLGYYDEDEYFYIVDRIKELIKYKGFQVPPAELEALLLSNPNIKDCGVVGLPDEMAGELPFAFIVKQTGKNITEKEVQDFVADNVSNAKRLHGGVSFVQNIPKNASGKILRRELKEMLKTHKSKL